MKVTSLEAMESVVSRTKSLRWDGWTVVNLIKTDKARTSKNGVFVNGAWYIQNRYVPTSIGWDIPDRFMR